MAATPTPENNPALGNTTIEALLRKIADPASSNTMQVQENIHKPEEDFGMSLTELSITLSVCGLNTGEEVLLPLWFCKINEKGQNDNTRNQIIIQQLQNIIF
jgi:hypothetical protein